MPQVTDRGQRPRKVSESVHSHTEPELTLDLLALRMVHRAPFLSDLHFNTALNLMPSVLVLINS